MQLAPTPRIPKPRNPQHVDNLVTLRLLEAQGFTGPDASLEVSLVEYGSAWREFVDDDGKPSWLIVYWHPSIPRRFDRAVFAKDTDPLVEWNWVDWAAVVETSGTPLADLLALPLPELLHVLTGHYGFENVFGTSYWEGFAIRGLRFD